MHGAFGGGWVWQEIAARLRAAGHRVYTPTLAGVGARSHLATPEIDLSTHIEDVVALLEFERLDDVILVGHSYGGFVIAGVADHVPERLAHVVYLDALGLQPRHAVPTDPVMRLHAQRTDRPEHPRQPRPS